METSDWRETRARSESFFFLLQKRGGMGKRNGFLGRCDGGGPFL
jgi:hypothetical protein